MFFEPQSAAGVNTLADCRKHICFKPVQRLNCNSYSVFARFVVYDSQSRVYLFETIFSVESVRHAARTPLPSTQVLIPRNTALSNARRV